MAGILSSYNPGLISPQGRAEMGQMDMPRDQFLQQWAQKIQSGQATWLDLIAAEKMKQEYDALKQAGQMGQAAQQPQSTVAQDISAGLPSLQPERMQAPREPAAFAHGGVAHFARGAPAHARRRGPRQSTVTPNPAPASTPAVTPSPGATTAPGGGAATPTPPTGSGGSGPPTPPSPGAPNPNPPPDKFGWKMPAAVGATMAGLTAYGLMGGDDEKTNAAQQENLPKGPRTDISEYMPGLAGLLKQDASISTAGTGNINNPMNDLLGKMSPRPQEVTQEEAEKTIAERKEKIGYGKADAERRAAIDKESDDLIKGRKQDMWINVFAPAFFKMAEEGATNNFFTSAAKGANLGIEQHIKLKDKVEETERRIRDERYQLDKADEVERLGDYDKATVIRENSLNRIEKYDEQYNRLLAQKYTVDANIAIAQMDARTRIAVANLRNTSQTIQLWALQSIMKAYVDHKNDPVKRDAVIDQILEQSQQLVAATNGSVLAAQTRVQGDPTRHVLEQAGIPMGNGTLPPPARGTPPAPNVSGQRPTVGPIDPNAPAPGIDFNSLQD